MNESQTAGSLTGVLRRRSSARRVWLFTGLGLGALAFYMRYWIIGVDYHFTYYPAVEEWLAGTPIYTETQLLNAPWLVLFLAPFQFMTKKGGQAALALFTLACMARTWQIFASSLPARVRAWSLAMYLFNLYTFDLFWRGQIDGIVLFAFLLVYLGHKSNNPFAIGAGWVMAAIKPPSTLLFWIYSAYLAYRTGHFIRAMIIPLGTLFTSFFLFGLDWPARMVDSVFVVGPPQAWIVTLLRMADYLRISRAWMLIPAVAVVSITYWIAKDRLMNFDHMTIGLIMAASLVVAPHALSYHYAGIAIIIAAPLVKRNTLIGVLLYLISFLAVVRVPFGPEVAWIDIAFPVTAWMLYVYYLSKEVDASESSAHQLSAT